MDSQATNSFLSAVTFGAATGEIFPVLMTKIRKLRLIYLFGVGLKIIFKLSSTTIFLLLICRWSYIMRGSNKVWKIQKEKPDLDKHIADLRRVKVKVEATLSTLEAQCKSPDLSKLYFYYWHGSPL